MTPEEHARLKEVFLAASELPANRQAAFLEQACGDDWELRRQVERLLAHNTERTIVGSVAAAPKPTFESAQHETRLAMTRRFTQATARVVRTFSRTFGHRGSFSLAAILGGVLLFAAGLWLHRGLSRALREVRRDELRVFLDSEVSAVEDWLRYERERADLRSRDTTLCAVLEAFSDPGFDEGQLRTYAGQERVRREFEAEGGRGLRYLVFGRRQRCLLASATDADLIGETVTPLGAQFLRRVLAGETIVRFPHDQDILLCGEPRSSDKPIVSVLVPICDAADEKTLGALLLLSDTAAERFHSLLTRTRSGTSGEAYAFDATGTLLSESRFNDELRAIGLLSDTDRHSSLRVQVRDPGGDLTAGFRTSVPLAGRPLTHMAALATAKQDGIELNGYRDYRGVRVIGAWKWLEPYGVGIAAEIDEAEAFAPMRSVNLLFTLGAGMVLGAVVLIGYTWRSWRRLQRTIGQSPELGPYSLIERIGEGGMGTVWLAQHRLLKRPTALKLLKPEHMNERMCRWFEREVQLAARLTHPNTIEIFDFGQTPEGLFYYAMEYLPGLSLDQLVSRAGPLPPGRAIRILQQVCAAMSEAHTAGLVHRDIKPQNIMLCERGGEADLVKVLDFGLAKDIGREGPNPMTSAMAGTPQYMAPERLRNPLNADARSDLYSIGAVGFYLLTGREVFVGATDADVFYHVLNSAAPDIAQLVAGLPPELVEFVNGSLHKEPDERPQSAAELMALLRAARAACRWSDTDAMRWWQSYRAADPRRASLEPAPDREVAGTGNHTV